MKCACGYPHIDFCGERGICTDGSPEQRLAEVEQKLDDLIRAFSRLAQKVEGIIETHRLWDGS